MEDQENNKKLDADTELQKCFTEKEEYLDGWKRTKADLINYKKEEAKRFDMIMRFSQEALLRELIQVLDSFDLAENSLRAEEQSRHQKGLLLIKSQLEDIVRKNGLERVGVKKGDIFDPNFHEAITSEESAEESGTVLEEIEKGYFLNGKLLRPARVKVAK